MRRAGGAWVRRHPVLVILLFIPWMAIWLSLAGFANAEWTRFDQHRFPWAYPESGQPTLTGLWAGRLTTDRGARRGLLLDLQLVPLKFGHAGRRTGKMDLRFFHRMASDNLTGALHVCGGPKGEQHFTLRGNIVTDDASRFRVSLSVADSALIDGLALGAIRGTWDGLDSLRIEADLYVRQGTTIIRNPRDSETTTPQPGALHRADAAEFRSVCERLWTGQ
jgi:hypothetical protein